MMTVRQIYGLACPRCDYDSFCRCPNCNRTGDVSEFRIDGGQS